MRSEVRDRQTFHKLQSVGPALWNRSSAQLELDCGVDFAEEERGLRGDGNRDDEHALCYNLGRPKCIVHDMCIRFISPAGVKVSQPC